MAYCDIFLYIAIGCLLLMYFWKRKTGGALSFPGPPGLPLFGCYFSIRGKPMHQVLYDWSMQYGGAFRYSVFGKQSLVITHPDVLREALVTRGDAFSGRARFLPLQEFTDNYQNIASTNNLAQNRAVRKVVLSSLKTCVSEKNELAAGLHTAIDDLLATFSEKGGRPFDPKQVIYDVVSLTIILTLCGRRTGEISDISTAVRELNDAVTKSTSYDLWNSLLVAVPMLRHLSFFPPCARLQLSLRKRDLVFDHLIWPALEDHRQDTGVKTIGQALLAAIGKQYGTGDERGRVDLINVKQASLDAIIAGTATLSTAFYALLNVLQWNPDIQERIYEEILQEVGCETVVSLEHRNKLPYTRATVLEVLRHTTVLPLSFPHVTRCHTELDGIAVPQGTEVVLNLWACHHDPRLWPDPWTFKPGRFLDEDGQLLAPDHVNMKQMFVFGGGRRNCVGEILANNRLVLFTANCVQTFRFLPPDGADPTSCDPRNYEYGIIMDPPSYKIKAIPRMQCI